MTHVSKQALKKRVTKELSEQFLSYILEANTATRAQALILELLTPTERIMLAKRLAIVIMLEYGYGFEQIEQTLRVSSSTVARLWSKKHKNLFSSIEEYCRRHKNLNTDAILGFIEKLLQAGLPPQGRGRWKYTFSAQLRKDGREN